MIGADCEGKSTCELVLKAAEHVEVAFEDVRDIPVTLEVTGEGSVSSSDGRFSCTAGQTCSATYAFGETLNLTAASLLPNIVNWSIVGCSGDQCSAQIDGALHVGVTFIRASLITVRSDGNPAVSVLDGRGMNLPAQYVVALSASHTLQIAPGPDDAVVGIDGVSCAGGVPVEFCTFTPTERQTEITAHVRSFIRWVSPTIPYAGLAVFAQAETDVVGAVPYRGDSVFGAAVPATALQQTAIFSLEADAGIRILATSTATGFIPIEATIEPNGLRVFGTGRTPGTGRWTVDGGALPPDVLGWIASVELDPVTHQVRAVDAVSAPDGGDLYAAAALLVRTADGYALQAGTGIENSYYRIGYNLTTRQFDSGPELPYTSLSFPLLSARASMLNIAADAGTATLMCGATSARGPTPPFAGLRIEENGACSERAVATSDGQYTGIDLETMTIVMSSSPLNGAGELTIAAYDHALNLLWDTRLRATGPAATGTSPAQILQLMRLPNGRILAMFAGQTPRVDGYEGSQGQRFACGAVTYNPQLTHYPLVFAELEADTGRLVWGRCLTAAPGSDVDPFLGGGHAALFNQGVVVSQFGAGVRADGGTLRVGSFTRPLTAKSGNYLMYLTPP